MLFGLLTGLYGNAKTEDVIVSDYKVDFETPIVTNTGKYGDADRDFIVSTGWGHLVGMLETGYNNTPTYVPYIYNKTNGGVQVLAVNTLGVLYIVEDGDTVHSIADLKGRTIYAGGKGATPEYALNYILEKNGLVPGEDVTIEWKSEHAECVAALAEDADGIAMLPQPFVTTAQTKKETLRTALDLTEEWNKIQESEGTASTLVTGVTVVRTAFAKEHPEAVADFMEAYQASVSYVTENTDEAAKLIGDYDIVPEAVAKKALPACNIVCITGDEMKEKLSGYLGVLKDQNPEAVGGELPGDDFYYSE